MINSSFYIMLPWIQTRGRLYVDWREILINDGVVVFLRTLYVIFRLVIYIDYLILLIF